MKNLVYWSLLISGFGLACADLTSPNDFDGKRDFEVEPGISLQLIASEPLVIDPVAFTFDEYANMYVVEHRGYPDPAEGGQPTKKDGRIAKLIDFDQDGIYDQRAEYALDFTYPNGIMYWKGGVFVTCAPDIFYLKDTTGDGQADIRKVVLTGFHDTKTAQIRMSHPTLGLDSWIYITGGLNGGNITSPEHPERDPVIYQTGDGRFNPETFKFEVTGGKSQFGLTIDPFGRRFGCSNRHPVQHIVIEPQSLARNPFLPHSETIQNVSKVQEEAVVYPISGASVTADFIPKLIGRSHQGTFTAASGLLIYSDAGLGVGNQGNAFICESAQSLVQSQTVHQNGVSFTSKISNMGSEFLASRDEWFRPVFLGHGPLPGLYIADMRRKVIDHPSYVPEAIRADLDFESGRDEGRIYRLVATDLIASSPVIDGENLSEIQDLLTSRWEWQRALAFRIIVERKDTSLSKHLRHFVAEAPLIESKVRSLWLLHLLGTLDEKTLIKALQHHHSLVREQAVQIISLMPNVSKQITRQLLQLGDDSDHRVRFLTSLALGSYDNAQSALSSILARDGADDWSRVAALSSIGPQIEEFLHVFQNQKILDLNAYGLVMQDLGVMLANGSSHAACQMLFSSILDAPDQFTWKIPAILGLVQGFSSRPGHENTDPITSLLGDTGSVSEDLFSQFLKQTLAIISSEQYSLDLRRQAILLLGYTSKQIGLDHLYQLMKEDSAPAIKSTIVEALTSQNESTFSGWLVSDQNWPSFSPQIRSQIIMALLSRRSHSKILLHAIKKGTVLPTDISASDRERLMRHEDKEIAHLSNELFKDLEGGDRIEIYNKYKVQWKEGHAKNGVEIFKRACAICHTYAGQGGQVGPDLTGVKNQPAEALLLHTLVPNYEVYPIYQAMTLQLQSGETKIGWIKSETEHALTICTAAGKEENLLKSNIKLMKNTGRSLMPEGFENSISSAEMNDLITYLKSAN